MAERTQILVLVSDHDEQTSLRGILDRSTWEMRTASTWQQARRALDESAIAVIIADPELADGHSWRDIADSTIGLYHRPALIVASRFGDERLWAEVLNLGGFDVILKPFVAKEVLHSVSMAWRWWREQYETAASAAAERSVPSAPG